MDYIDDILSPGEEIGLRVDTGFVYAPTACVVKAVHAYNLNYILKAIGFTGLNLS